MFTNFTNLRNIQTLILMLVMFIQISFLSAQESNPVDLKERIKSRKISDQNTGKSGQNSQMSIIINVPLNYPTIQGAINAANNGDIINISAGTYREDIILNKPIQIRGANYGINPNTGMRGPETIIQPATSDPDPYSPTAVTFFYIGSNGSGAVIDGITFDGDNPTLTSSVNINGANIDAAEAIGAYDGLANIMISNNIIKNVNYAGIDLYNYTNGGASTYDNTVSDNKFDNIMPSIFGIGVLIYNNCYCSISDNVMTRVRVGVQTGNFYNADLGLNHSINNNEIESSRLGIWYNLSYTNASTFIISNNEITTYSGATNNNGISVTSVQSSVSVTVTDNIISDARNGYNLWNCPTTSNVTITGGTVTNCNVGVFANNYDGYSSNADPSSYAMTGITLTNCDTGVWVRDNSLNTNNSTVALSINNTTNIISGTGIGVLLEGGDASLAFSGAVPVDFSTSLSKYIRLASNTINTPTGMVNAENVTFGGLAGSAMTNAQLFAVEDKIDHKIDWSSLGFVSIKIYNKYLTLNSYYTPETTSPLISRGIDAAASGDTLNLGAGTFNESVTINKSITLKGSGTSVTILAPSVICTGDGINVNTSNVNVNDLTVKEFNYGLRTSASNIKFYNVESILNCQYAITTNTGTNGLTILKCKFNSNVVGGWRAGTGDLINNVLIDSSEVKYNGTGGNGFGIFAAASTPAANTFDNITIKNSDFSRNLRKGMYFEKLRYALIDNVIMDSSGTDATYGFNNGIDINLKYDSYTDITIQNCSITNCGFNGTATNPDNPSAVTIKARDDSPSYSSDPATLSTVAFKNNFVSGPRNGLRFGEFDKVNNTPSGITVIENDFGNGYLNKAVLNKTASNIAISCNWYGTAIASSVVALHGSNLTFLPYLVNGTDNNLSLPGFQPVPGSCTGTGPVVNLTQSTDYVTIQSAINAANPFDVIQASEGTYNERVTITKSLTLQGVNEVNCKVDGTGLSGTGRGILISNGITDVIIKRLTVQNFAGASGNTDAGIYAIGGNNSLLIEHVTIKNNVGGSGFYANGPINNVTIDSVTSSGHTSGARGIVIWNGLKENISITNCTVFNNNCCGIELQDGQASGVTITGNNIHDNGDNGIGVVGLQGPGENLIKLNTLLNNGRFGIELKNPNGSGAVSGAGRIVVEDNNVSRTIAIVDNRDICGIASFRRSVLVGNVDIPTGTVIQNNTVSGYTQPSTSEGFGIVVEGMNHTVTGNNVSGCDVGIQRQAGHLPYPGDGDQSNLADTYFGRGNSPMTCGVTVSGNILSNTINTRDVGTTGSGIVKNLNTGKMFCSIQSAIDDATTLNTHVIDIDSANYTESVVVNKELTIRGNGGSPNSKPVVEGVSGQTFSVTAPNVTIDNVLVRFNQTTVNTGIRAATSGSFNNLTIKNSCIYGTATTGVVIFASFGIQLGTFGGALYDNVSLDSNEIKHTGTSPLGRGVKTYNCYGDWKNSIVEGYYSYQSGDIQGGILNITGNTMKGETEINYLGSGSHSFSGNTSSPSNAFGSGTDFAMLELKNISLAGANIIVSNNNFLNYTNFGVFSGRSNNVTIDNNIFTPDPTAVIFKSVRIDTKQRTIAPQPAFVSGATITKNTFNGNTALGQTGISVEIANSDSLSSIGTVILGTAGNENNFSNNVSKRIVLNNETTSTSGDPYWTGTYISTKAKVTADIDAINNKYDVGSGLEFPLSMSITNLFSLEDKIQHVIDDGGLGLVTVKANNDYVTVNSFVSPATTTPSIQRGIDAASSGFTVNVGPGSFTEQLEINKALTLLGQGISNTEIISPNTLTLSYVTSGTNKPIIYVHDASDVAIKQLTVNGAGKGNANNRFQGIAYRNAGGTVRDCDIKAIRNTPIDGVQAGVGLYALADNGTSRTLDVIKTNIFDFQKNAATFAGADLYAKVDSNTITGAGPVNFIAQNGIQLSSGAGGIITHNNISNISYTPSTWVSCGILLYQPEDQDTTAYNTLTACQVGIYYYEAGGKIFENTNSVTAASAGTTTYWGIVADPGSTPKVPVSPSDAEYLLKSGRNLIRDSRSAINTSIYQNVLTSDGTNGTGIEMDALGTETLNASAYQNFVNGWDAAIVFYKDAGATLNGSANDNNLSGNVYALYDLTGVNQNGTCNWFGTTDQSVIMSKVSGAVTYAPYLTNGTDDNGSIMGFQPVAGSCNGYPIIAYYVNDNSLTGDVFTTAVGSNSNPGTPSAPFLTVSHAVSVANNNDTIYIDAGTYQEQVNINKSLTIYGADSAGSSATIIKAPAVMSYVSNANATDHRPVVYISGVTTTVDISHLCIDGDGRGGDKFSGIYYFEASGKFEHNRIIKVRDAVYSGNQSGNAFFANHTYDVALDHTVIVNDNVIEDFQKTGILINEINTQGIVTNNIVIGQNIVNVNGENGIQFGYGAYGTLTGNTVTNNLYNGPGSDDASGILLAGVGVDQTNTPTGKVTTIGGAGALANNLSGNEVSLLTDGGGFGYNSNAGVVYNANNFSNNYIHVAHLSPSHVPAVVNVYDKRIDNTAQTNIVYGQIQRSVDDAAASDVLIVSAHTFTEQVEIDKALTLSGQGMGSTVIVSPNILPLSYVTSGTNKPVIYIHDASDVIVRNLTVDGAGKGNANNRFQGVAYHNAGGVLRECEIKAVRNTPIDGVQAGVGIYAYADNGNPRTLDVSNNTVYDFQKNATVFAGDDLSVTVDSNTVTGAGPVSFIAQNGIQLSTGANGSITNNILSNISYIPSTVVSCGILLYQPDSPDTTTNNSLTGCQVGIYYIEASGLINENIVNSTAVNTGTTSYWGIDADPGGTPRVVPQPADIQVTTNRQKLIQSDDPETINTLIKRNELISDGVNGTGLEMDALGTETLNATAIENKINGWDAGVVFYKESGATLNGVVNDNDLSLNTYALYDYTGVTQNASCNWFGTTNPVTILGMVNGAVNYVPYLISGTDDNPGIRGFQPTAGTCTGIPPSVINIKVIQEGFYNASDNLNKADTVRAYVHSSSPPYNVIDSSISIVDSVTFTGSFVFNNAVSGTYYISVKHRNTIETWSKSGGEPFVSGSTMNYDFTDLATKAFGSNMIQVDTSPVRFGIYSGDVNQDGLVEAADNSAIENDASMFTTGYVSTDLTGEDFVDGIDQLIADNNSANFVQKVTP